MNIEFKNSSNPLWGTQIYPSVESIKCGVNKADDLGIFVGHGKPGHIFVVKFDRHTVRSYSSDFWTIDSKNWKG